MKSIDFDLVAPVYDLYVSSEFDHAFWVEECRRHAGPCLEVMCGTGRISLAVLRAGVELTCVDYSAGMLEVLRAKLRGGPTARVLERDARDLGFSGEFGFAFIGFHSLSELITPADRLAALRSLHQALRAGGRLTLSLQNPRVRGPQLDGQWRELATVPLPGTPNRLEVRGRFPMEPATRLVRGVQVYRELDPQGRCVREQELPVSFQLVEPGELLDAAAQAGFRSVEVWGDYDRSPFDPAASPFFLSELGRE
jgi:SAM-dependent methyltransferase